MNLDNFIDSLFSSNSKKESEISKDIPLTIIPLSNIAQAIDEQGDEYTKKEFESPEGLKVKVETKTTKKSYNEFTNLRQTRNNNKRTNSIKSSRNQSKRIK